MLRCVVIDTIAPQSPALTDSHKTLTLTTGPSMTVVLPGTHISCSASDIPVKENNR